ncbi:polyphenol oxidase family protein [Candidatus Peregrinibacteria bacterium]|nr:polyphenol oxidase family protein [Candidatus Peregrinibacteria bacterium]
MKIVPRIFKSYAREISAEFLGKPFDFSKEDWSKAQYLKKYPPVFSDQIHSDAVEIVETSGVYLGKDAFVTQKKNIPLLIKTADCIAALLFDPQTKTIAAVHAGWRGIAKCILPKVIAVMEGKFLVDSRNILIALSPSIELLEFTNPLAETPAFFHPFVNTEYQVDLWKIAKNQLCKNGILEKHIEMPTFCTYTDPKKRFWSHRRGEAGRNGAIITLLSAI